MTDEPIRLLLSDVDGTLVRSDKTLAPATVRAVAELREHGVLFSITSARPPRGFSMFVDPLDVTVPLGAFNGGLMVSPAMKTLREFPVDESLVGPVIEALFSSNLAVWVYQNTDWFVLDLNGIHVAHESDVVQFRPSEVPSFDEVRSDVVKIVGVSDDPAAIARGQAAVAELDVSATTSQSYYLDITDPRANKGSVVDFLAAHLSIETSSIAVIGDAHNDLAMFERAGLSIAMGNAVDEVKARADYVTTSHDEDGLAHAISTLVLPRAPH